jgi:nucleotide-binding universal stress UspA family protein
MSRFVILVGVDGSPASQVALRWALEEGALRECLVELVTVCASSEASNQARDDLSSEARDELERHAAEVQRHSLDLAMRETNARPVISREVVRGDPVDVLPRLTTAAGLLVIGAHGTHGLRHAGAGSVSDACTRLAECPTVVVPPPLAESGPAHSAMTSR